MKFCAVILGPKNKIEFVWDKNLITSFPILPQFLKKLHCALWSLQSGITRSPQKIIARCLHLPPIFRSGLSDDVVKISSLLTTVAVPTNFRTKIDYNSALVKNNCALFSPIPYFRAWSIR